MLNKMTGLRRAHEVAMKPAPKLADAKYYPRREAPARMVSAAKVLEDRFGIQFATFAHFPEALFARLHALPSVPPALPPSVVVASQQDSSVLEQVEVFVRVANTPNPTSEARRAYFDSLLAVYERLPCDPASLLSDDRTLCVGIQREGTQLAESLHRLPSDRSIRPHAKRILYDGGLVVGLKGIEEVDKSYDECVITDGAIASGATLMAIMHLLSPWVRSFHVFSVHSSWQGIMGLRRFADEARVCLKLIVGHATDGMNKKYYATIPGSDHRLVIGDVGDTIADL